MVVFKVCGKHVSNFSHIFKQGLVKTIYNINKNKSTLVINKTIKELR
jgi:hypothetical protein